MPNPTCATCRKWECSDADRKDAAERRCLARAPGPYATTDPDGVPARNAVWPWTSRDESCGAHSSHDRDRLAAMMAQGILASGPLVCGQPPTADWVAHGAYALADALIAEGGNAVNPK